MNKLCFNLLKQTLQSNVVRGSQIASIPRITCYSTEAGNKLPLSKNPKHKTSPQITLLSKDKIEVMTLDQATKLAERRQLKLVSILDHDTKTKRPVYKLMTGTEYHAEEIKRREEKKESRKEQHIKAEKLLTLSSKISDHDLQSKIAKVVKWIEKLHEVRVVVSGGESEMQKMEKIAAMIEEEATKVAGRSVQKRIKNGEIKFSLLPTIKKEATTEAPIKPAASKKLLEQDKAEAQVRSIHTMTI